MKSKGHRLKVAGIVYWIETWPGELVGGRRGTNWAGPFDTGGWTLGSVQDALSEARGEIERILSISLKRKETP